MFYNCKSLISIDLSDFNTQESIYIGKMFCNCKSLLTLDLSNYNTQKVFSMIYMFSGCKSLKRLPDISKWKPLNTVKIDGIFEGCSSILCFPDISKWHLNTDNIFDKSYSDSSEFQLDRNDDSLNISKDDIKQENLDSDKNEFLG